MVLGLSLLVTGCFHDGNGSGAPEGGGGGGSGVPIDDPYANTPAAASGRARLADLAPMPDRTWRALERKAGTAGTVRITVALRVPTRREGLLSQAQRALQRSRIQQVGARVVARIPGAKNIRVFESIPFLVMDANAQALQVLRRLPVVLTVAEDQALELPDPFPKRPNRPPNEAAPQTGENESYNEALEDWWHYFRTNVDDANNARFKGRSEDGTTQTIAIVDSGVQSGHPWFQAGKVVEEACFAALHDSADTTQGACPNRTARQGGQGAAAPCDYHLHCFHGTHVAGIAAGKWGVAPEATVIAVQVFHPLSQEKISVNATDIIDALAHLASLTQRYNIAAVNFSLGGGQFNQSCDAADANWAAVRAGVQVLVDRGVAVVAATGNDGFEEAIAIPACLSNVISVGNTTLGCAFLDEYAGACPAGALEDKVWHESNSASFISLLAPGTHICSSSTMGIAGVELPPERKCPQDETTWQVGGTSQAAPHVAGAIALLKQYAAENRKDARVATLLGALQSSGVAVSGKGETKTRIDVWAAINWMHCGRTACA
jgi:subtilisin family serine protease